MECCDNIMTISWQVVSITSFNEWGEGTQIEPVDDNPPVPLDMSVHGGGKMTSGVTGTCHSSTMMSSSFICIIFLKPLFGA